MNERNLELVNHVLADFAGMNLGPGASLPGRTVWLRRTNDGGGVTGAELADALEWGAAEEQGYFSLREGGIAGLGTVTLTERGYKRSRDL